MLLEMICLILSLLFVATIVAAFYQYSQISDYKRTVWELQSLVKEERAKAARQAAQVNDSAQEIVNLVSIIGTLERKLIKVTKYTADRYNRAILSRYEQRVLGKYSQPPSVVDDPAT